jgi:hypothetical protein
MKRTLLLTSLLLLLGILVGSTAAMASPAQPAADVIDQDFQFQENNTTTENQTTTPAENETTTADDVNTETDDTNGTNETGEGNETEVENETEPANETIGPGARLSGIVGAHQAELRGAVSERAFGLSVAAAVSNGSRARMVQTETEHLEVRLQELENESAALEAASQNGTVSNGTYQARSTTLTAQINALESRINQTSVEGEQLSATVRAAHGVNMTRLAELQAAAGNATGQEMASIARSIAGPRSGHPGVRRGPPAHAGPSMGPPTNVTPGAPRNATNGPPNNTTMGPPEGTQMGPPNNTTMGPPDDSRMGPPNNKTRGPQSDRGEGPSSNQTNTSDGTGSTGEKGISGQ